MLNFAVPSWWWLHTSYSSLSIMMTEILTGSWACGPCVSEVMAVMVCSLLDWVNILVNPIVCDIRSDFVDAGGVV